MYGHPSSWTPNDGVAFARQIVAETNAPPEKRPLYRDLPPAPVFPLDALGPLRDAAVAIQQRTQAPMAIAAQSVLAATTLAVQAQRDVGLPAGGSKPLTGIFVSIAESGERKSSVDRLALAAIYEVEQEWRQQSDGERQSYANAKDAWDHARQQAKQASKKGMTDLKAALDAIGPEPKAPSHPMLIVADPTPEALTLHLAEGRPFAGVFTAEGGLLIGGAAFNEESQMRTAALLNTLWDGEPIRRKRVTTGAAYLPGRRCSVHIMVQPVVANSLFGHELFDGIGLTARMLLVAPDSTAGTRFFKDINADTFPILAAYNDRLKHLLQCPPVTKPDMPDVLDPPAMRFSYEAKAAWIAFHDECEKAVAVGGPLNGIRAFAGKLPEHAGRLAGVLTVYHDTNAMEIPAWAMQCGVQLATYYANEMLRLRDGAFVPPKLASAQRLLDWWRAQIRTEIYLARIYQFGPSDLRNAEAARDAVLILEDHGWIEKLQPGTELEGKPRKEAWRLRP